MEANDSSERGPPAVASAPAPPAVLATARLAAIVESSDDAIISKDLDGIITSWNSGAEALFGYTAAEAIGQPVTLLMPPDRFDEEPGILDRIRRRERVEHYETVRKRKDGTLLEISLTVSPIIDERGSVIGASKIARDITERKRAERALRDRTEQFETLFREVPVGVYLVDESLRMLELNPVAQRVFDEVPGGVIGRAFDEVIQLLLEPALAAETVRLFRHTLETGEACIALERAEQSPDRSATRYYDWRLNRIKLPDGTFGLVCCFRDITSFVSARADRQRLLDAERAARMAADQANRTKDDFLATLSHELRTPMNAVLSWLHLMQLKPGDSAIAEQGLAAIDRGIRTQVQLIDDLLDLNRIVSGKLRIEHEVIELDAVVEAAIETVGPHAKTQGITIHRSFKTRDPVLRGDFTRLQQVFWNLLSNAIKFTPRNGHIEVVLERHAALLQVTVTDTGHGIAPDVLPHVFERFKQADSSTTRTHGGLGLGLAIVKNLVELHGGSVQAESAGPGCGARFIVTLPAGLHEPALEQGARAPSVTGEYDLTGVQVLLVDDDPETLAVIGRLLSQYNAEVETASTAEEALERLQASHPDILISDISMPERDGYELIQELRTRPRCRTLPAVALTAFARSEDRARIFQAGYNLHVPKPADPHELLAVVASAVRSGSRRGRRTR